MHIARMYLIRSTQIRFIGGGTGYCISLGDDGKEYFDKAKNNVLPEDIEYMFPDYSIYPQYNFCVSMTSRGCPRGCSFCHVKDKEGLCSKKVADVSDFYSGQKVIEVCDPNIAACRDKFELYEQYADTKAKIVFNQGLDIRLITDRDIDYFNRMRIKDIHFAWDNPNDDLESKFAEFSKLYKPDVKASHGNKGMVYVLTNFDSTMEENIFRVTKLRELGFDPYVMVYNKPSAPKEIRRLQRWVNNKFIFYKTNTFEEYMAKES